VATPQRGQDVLPLPVLGIAGAPGEDGPIAGHDDARGAVSGIGGDEKNLGDYLGVPCVVALARPEGGGRTRTSRSWVTRQGRSIRVHVRAQRIVTTWAAVSAARPVAVRDSTMAGSQA